jgi:hypothetical protein
MLWERKIQLEKEMQDALDPTIGGDIVEAMKKEIHRMELRRTELARQQEKLIAEMEKAILRRDLISMKARVTKAKKAPALTEAGLKKAVSILGFWRAEVAISKPGKPASYTSFTMFRYKEAGLKMAQADLRR